MTIGVSHYAKPPMDGRNGHRPLMSLIPIAGID